MKKNLNVHGRKCSFTSGFADFAGEENRSEVSEAFLKRQ